MNSNIEKKPLTPNSAWPFIAQTTQSYAFWDEAFTPEECQKIIDIGEGKILEKGLTENGKNDDARKCEVGWLYAADNLEWVCRRITDIVLKFISMCFPQFIYLRCYNICIYKLFKTCNTILL